ncbi:MAG: hypothetical protein KGQ37_06900 [Hyphomicrobiales bacterium]|nr:hypothetical protein [Hyphomicrobiales bacterium]
MNTIDYAARAHQSRARPLTDAEQALADALEAIFATRVTDFTEVVAQLNARGVAIPSRPGGTWTLAGFTAEIAAINAALDGKHGN